MGTTEDVQPDRRLPTGSAQEPAGCSYPAYWEADVVLRDGSTTHIRPIRPSDADALQAFHVAQSEQSTFLRFFAALERLSPRDLERFTRVDHRDRAALVAVTGDEAIIAVARYDRIGPTKAEVAFNIADSQQGRGLGSVLLEHLAAAARERGIRGFVAEVLPQNGRMIAVFREAGYSLLQRWEDGVVQVSFDIDPTERSLAVMASRERIAEARSMQGLLTARRVLLIASAGADPHSLAARRVGRVLSCLLAGSNDAYKPTTGAVTVPATVDEPTPLEIHVVGAVPGADSPGVRRWERLADVPAEVDLAVLALPAAQTEPAVRALGRLGVRGVVLLTDDVAENEPSGQTLHQALARTAHAAGMRVIGPASYGVLSHTGAGLMNASLAEQPPPPGRIGVFCQSAPTAVSVLEAVRRRGLGLAHLVSAGHRVDVSGNDLMQFWREDESTDVVALYLESIGNPRKFARVARLLATSKPVVVVAAGGAGHVVPPGHTTTDALTSRRTLDEILPRSGVVLVANTRQMVETAQLFAMQPLPAGSRTAIVASSTSLAALVTRAATSIGLRVDREAVIIEEEAQESEIAERLGAVYADSRVDAVVAVHVPTVGPRDNRVAHTLARLSADTSIVTVATLPGLRGATAELTAVDADGHLRTIPAFTTPEDAVDALGRAVRYAAWRRADRGSVVHPEGMRTREARRLVQDWLDHAGQPSLLELTKDQITELLSCAGIELIPAIPVGSAQEAVDAADRLGWPVALKSTAPLLRHRADLGGVRLDVHDAGELRADVHQVLALAAGHQPLPNRAPLEVQPMVPHGVACVIRSAEDPLYGPVLGFGLAGDTVDLLDDLAYAVPPLTEVDVSEVVRAPRSAPRLFGYHGLPLLDVAAVEDVLARIGMLADDLPELAALELNPVVVSERGARVLDASVHVAPAAVRTDGVRRVLTS